MRLAAFGLMVAASAWMAAALGRAAAGPSSFDAASAPRHAAAPFAPRAPGIPTETAKDNAALELALSGSGMAHMHHRWMTEAAATATTTGESEPRAFNDAPASAVGGASPVTPLPGVPPVGPTKVVRP